MKIVYTYSEQQIQKIIKDLEGAKKVLDGDPYWKIEGCKAAISKVQQDLMKEDDESVD